MYTNGEQILIEFDTNLELKNENMMIDRPRAPWGICNNAL